MSTGLIRSAVFPVAGRGTRFLPATKSVPKEVLPIVDRPCIEYVVSEAVAAGIEQIVFVTATGKEALVNHFLPSPDLEAFLERNGNLEMLDTIREIVRLADIVSVKQDVALGLGHAVLQAKDVIGHEDFAVLLGDDIIDSEQPAIGQLIEAHEQGQAVVALMEVPQSETGRYGVCAGPMLTPKRMRVDAMVEKPPPEEAPSNCAIVGRYVLPADIWEMLEETTPGRGGEIQLTDAIAKLAGQGRVYGQIFDGDRFDTGNVLGLLRASLHYALKRPDLQPSVQAVIKEMGSR